MWKKTTMQTGEKTVTVPIFIFLLLLCLAVVCAALWLSIFIRNVEEVVSPAQVAKIWDVHSMLRIIGYDAAAVTGQMDGETRETLSHFQREHILPETGDPDDATV